MANCLNTICSGKLPRNQTRLTAPKSRNKIDGSKITIRPELAKELRGCFASGFWGGLIWFFLGGGMGTEGNDATDDYSDDSIQIQKAFGVLLSNRLALRLPEKSSKTPPAIA